MAETGEPQTVPGPVQAAGVDTALPPTQAAALLSSPVSRQGSLCPDEFLCPITVLLMSEPVLLVETGHTFEKSAIEQWFDRGNRTCPLTGVVLTSTQVSPNLTLRKLIQDWAARHPTQSAVAQTPSSSQNPHPQPNANLELPNTPVLPNSTPSHNNSQNEHWAARLPFAHRRAPRRARLSEVLESPLPPADDDEPLEAAPPENQEGNAPTVDAEPRLSLAAEFDTIGPLPREQLLVLAHVAAPETGKRVPVDLVAVLDVSGSMAADRLPLVKETLLFVISQLQSSDRLSIVAFCDRAQRAIRLTKATEQSKERLKLAVQGLRAGGGTSIASGLALGLHVLTSRRERNHVACMLLLSDGLDNFGGGADFVAQNQDLLTSATRDSVSVHTFGYGRNHDEHILDAIAEGTNGTFTFVRSNLEVKEAVAQCLGGALSVAAQATTISITAASGVAVLSVSAGAYEATVDEAQAAAKIDLKDMYSGETRDVLITVRVPAAEGDRSEPTELLSGRLQYTVPGQEKLSRSPNLTLLIARGEGPEGTGPNVDVDIQRNRLNAAKAMRVADRLAGENHLDQARDAIAAAMDSIRRSISGQAPACVALLEDLQLVGRGFASAREYQTEGSKVAKSSARMHSSQRAAYSSKIGASARRPSEYVQYASTSAVQMRNTASSSM
ncbi:hypothetical protein KFL_000170510 [Klebsormidium nitens]|uniref:RING-type E3 ubiquitin transferase n=1 Tax=Klebsormidium nitens TaxID=105231 RepID=A0A1Y1HJJ3_KLENI|nr:hypothetical protein KFL_000170510 [Klebsormidium nitens]|eukprot:GAQ78705.1 hypothetical protein KFL_000170510 [Klebsormidium nitens]